MLKTAYFLFAQMVVIILFCYVPKCKCTSKHSGGQRGLSYAVSFMIKKSIEALLLMTGAPEVPLVHVAAEDIHLSSSGRVGQGSPKRGPVPPMWGSPEHQNQAA